MLSGFQWSGLSGFLSGFSDLTSGLSSLGGIDNGFPGRYGPNRGHGRYKLNGIK